MRRTQTDGAPWGFAMRGEPPDAMLASQWSRDRERTPIELLMLAVLEEAVRTARLGNVVREKSDVSHFGSFSETVAWFQSENSTYVFAFRTICEHFTLPADKILRALFSEDGPTRSGLRMAPRRTLVRRMSVVGTS